MVLDSDPGHRVAFEPEEYPQRKKQFGDSSRDDAEKSDLDSRHCPVTFCEDGEVMLLQGDVPRCWICCQKGHRLRDCSFLQQLSQVDHDALCASRDAYFQTRNKHHVANPPLPVNADSKRPGWVRANGTRIFPQPLWPATTKQDTSKSSTENEQARLTANRP